MAITLLTIKGAKDVPEVYVDVDQYEDDIVLLKQHNGLQNDWVSLTKPMLLELYAWIGKELR